MIEQLFLGYIDPGTGFAFLNIGTWVIAFVLGFAGACFVFLKPFLRFLGGRLKQILIISACIFVCALGAMILMHSQNKSPDKRVFVLGLDGLSPDIMEPMMAGGELPNFTRLKNTGSYRHLETTNPSQSPVAWASFATGKNPGKTGIFDFIVRNPANYRLRLATASLEKNKPRRVVRAECFWEIASGMNIRNTILFCPLTFPPQKLRGRMASGMGTPDILGTEGTFTFYTTEPQGAQKDLGGNVFVIKKSPEMALDLIGPRVYSLRGAYENARAPFRASVRGNAVSIEYQGRSFTLAPGSWSPWNEVTFRIDPFRKVKGIFKFYLVGAQPEFKLYISPIDIDPRSPFYPVSYPSGYSRRIADEIGLYHTRGMPFDTWGVNENRIGEKALMDEADEILGQTSKLMEKEIGRFEKGILFCYFEYPDIMQHMFWRYTDPSHPLYEKEAPPEYKDAIRECYRKMDAIVGNVVRKMGENDTIIILSDHGFASFKRAVHVNSWLSDNGYLVLKGGRTQDTEGLLAGVDWAKTKAYAIGFGAIYLNMRGRETNGIVEGEEEARILKEELTEKLKAWVDTKYGYSVINNVYKNQDIFKGPFGSNAPDLFIGFNKGYRASWQTALGAVPASLIEDNMKKWSGDHLFDPSLVPGVIFTNKKITARNASIYDVAPTILREAGCDEEALKKLDMDGRPLFDDG